MSIVFHGKGPVPAPVFASRICRIPGGVMMHTDYACPHAAA